MLEKYKDNQKMFYNYFKLSFDKNRISHAYMIDTNNVPYAFNLALDLAKFFLCEGEFDEKICNLIDNDNYPNLKVLKNISNIKKEEIIFLKSDFSKSSIDNKKKVYIIMDAERMNKSSANSLLKFLEEPEGDVIAILLSNNISEVLPTILSRCQIINLINENDSYKSIFASLYEKSEYVGDFNSFVDEQMKKFLDIYSNFEKIGVDILCNNSFYELKSCVKEFLEVGYYLYFDILNLSLKRNKKYLPFDSDSLNIFKKNDISDIIYKIDVINKFIYNLRFNVNVNLFLDNFIISLGGIK